MILPNEKLIRSSMKYIELVNKWRMSRKRRLSCYEELNQALLSTTPMMKIGIFIILSEALNGQYHQYKLYAHLLGTLLLYYNSKTGIEV